MGGALQRQPGGPNRNFGWVGHKCRCDGALANITILSFLLFSMGK